VVAVLVDTLVVAVLVAVVVVMVETETLALLRRVPPILAVVVEVQFMVVLCTTQLAETVALVL